MPMITFSEGMPCAVQVHAPDAAAAAQFYGDLFGWTAEDSGDAFAILRKGAASVATLLSGEPAGWLTHFWTADVDAAVARATAAGGTVVRPPAEVSDAGRMAVLRDPAGAVLALWQPRKHGHAGLTNEPGTFIWSDLTTPDVEAVKPFYAAALGLTGTTRDMGPIHYTSWNTAEGRPIGGGMEGPYAAWTAYFNVTDVDVAVAQVGDLGGSVLSAAMDVPAGRFAVVADPQGAPFGLIHTNDTPPQT